VEGFETLKNWCRQHKKKGGGGLKKKEPKDTKLPSGKKRRGTGLRMKVGKNVGVNSETFGRER